MFEWRIALKYLLPKRKSLSTALISAMSVLVISLVVWLVLVFLSVTSGIEQNWLKKITSLYAPIRISPTDRYYSSYYYLSDSISAASNYTPKTIGEKGEAFKTDPYSIQSDMELPADWPHPEKRPDGSLLDPVKEAVRALRALQLTYQDYEIGGALLRLGLQRSDELGTSYLSQMTYLLSFTDQNPSLSKLVFAPSTDDLNYLLKVDPSSIAHIEIAPGTLEATARRHFDLPPENSPPWLYFVQGKPYLPHWDNEEGVLLPKFYRDQGVKIGDRGSLGYSASSSGSNQEQKIFIRVAGFYDPGILPVGSRCLIVSQEITRSIFAASQTFSPDGTPTNGFFVWTDHPTETKQSLQKQFEEAKIAPYWKIASYEEYEFAKDMLQQFKSDRTLFLLIAGIILLVACCNIISLLVLLVNDKKKEIAILQSMGASFGSIASIFGLCGFLTGAAACLLGSLAAIATLHHLDWIVALLTALQGHAPFHPAFFGTALPNQLSYEALYFVLIATPLLSLAAGLIPAIKASRIHPSQVLRSE